MASLTVNGREIDTTTYAGKRKQMGIFLLMTVVFIGACAALTYFNILMYIKTNLERYGTLTVGTVTSCVRHEDDEGDVSYHTEYSFSYVDGNGVERQGTGDTSSSRSYRIGSKVQVKYDAQGRSVIAGQYSDSFIINAGIVFFVGIIFYAVTMLLFGSFIASVVSLSIHKKFKKGNGKTATAMYIGVKPDALGNCHIKYSWEDEKGKLREGKSVTKFTSAQTEAFQNMGSFEIRYLGKVSDIISDCGVDEDMGRIEALARECSYCGTKLKAGDSECPNCGARLK